MRRCILPFILLICCTFSVYAQSHGLKFSSHEVVQEKRTSLNLTPVQPFCFNDNSEISFDVRFVPGLETYFGYIIRVVSAEGQNIDIVYNQRLRNFNFVIGEKFTGIFSIDSLKLYSQWNHFKIKFNNKLKEASLLIDNKLVAKGNIKLNKQFCCRIYFGASDQSGFQTVDIPPMRIKDIRVNENDRPRYYFPLSETTGRQATDSIQHMVATTVNPVWIKPLHQNWRSIGILSTTGSASIAFNKKTETLYVITGDTLGAFSIKSQEWKFITLSQKHDTLLAGNQSIINHLTNTIYNFYIDQQKLSIYDSVNARWDINFSPALLTEYWQANKFLCAADSSLYILGGYGQLQYKGKMQRYHFPTSTWEMVKTGGDEFMPRYLAALGATERGDTAYILGGYGSKTGDQAINPKYNYELLSFDVKRKSFKHLLQLKEPSRQFCFANSLVLDASPGEFYALTYPIDRFNSSLQLIRGSLHSPDYQWMADSIPYQFHDIESFADLFYCPESNKLVAVTLFSQKHNHTTLRLYTLDYPPNPLVIAAMPEESGLRWYYLLTGILVAAAGLYWTFGRKPRKPIPGSKATQPSPAEPVTRTMPLHGINMSEMVQQAEVTTPLAETSAPPVPRAEIRLFGELEITDSQGVNITRQFTPLLKELFLLMLVHSYKDGKGISSEKIYETLWHDKPLKDAKNNFSVNVVKLKNVLEKAGDCHLGKESGKWKLDILNDSITLDYKEYIRLLSDHTLPAKQLATRLSAIVSKGGFLQGLHYSWLDDIKADISSQVTDTLLKYISTADLSAEAETIIRYCNCIFLFDQLNEEALKYKCTCLVTLGRHGLAKEAYQKFSKEYKETYGEEPGLNFKELTGLE